jgi:hypothetical protein
MKREIWPALMLALFLAGCAPGASSTYQSTPYYEPGYYYDRVPPQNSSEVLGSQPGGHQPVQESRV